MTFVVLTHGFRVLEWNRLEYDDMAECGICISSCLSACAVCFQATMGFCVAFLSTLARMHT